MATTALTTVTVANWDAAEEYIADYTSHDAYGLTALTALHDADLHEIVLDPTTRTIWWAYDASPLDGDGWIVEQLPPALAAEQASDVIECVQDRQAAALTDQADCAYALGVADADQDQDALDEYAEILRLDVPADPARARVAIQRRRDMIARQDTPWRVAYAALVRDLVCELARTTKRGAQARAARVLGLSEQQVGRIVREDDARRFALNAAIARYQDA